MTERFKDEKIHSTGGEMRKGLHDFEVRDSPGLSSGLELRLPN